MIAILGIWFNLYPSWMYFYAYNSAMLIYVVSRLTQIYQTIKIKSTGDLTPIGPVLSAIGGFARLFTILVETSDQLLILNISFSALLNTILSSLFLVYRKESVINKK